MFFHYIFNCLDMYVIFIYYNFMFMSIYHSEILFLSPQKQSVNTTLQEAQLSSEQMVKQYMQQNDK